MATQKQILAACRRRWPKHQFEIRENKSAPTPAQRESIKAERAEWSDRKKSVDELLKAIGNPEAVWQKLIDAGQFVLDVNGDPTALDALRQAMASANEYTELRDESRELQQKLKSSKLHWRRFSVSRWDGKSMFTHGVCDGDTLDECLMKMECWSSVQLEHLAQT